MAFSGNTVMDTDRLSTLVTEIIRFAFRKSGRYYPRLATRVAVWIFTKPKRRKADESERKWLASANSYCVPFRTGRLAVMEWGKGPAILCVHGWSGYGLRFNRLIEPLIHAGYRIILFDAPAHGRSSGSHLDFMDYREAILAVADKVGPLYGIIAHSFGAGACLYAFEKGLKADKVIFVSALNGMRGPINYLAEMLQIPERIFADTKLVFERKFNRTIESLEALLVIPQLKTPPLLIFHDRDDPIIPHHNALDLLRVWKDAQLIDTPGGHEDILVSPQFIEETTSFLKNSTDH
ncbi:MAG: alpha/beta hydrolase [Acidobacteria bacterium]|nr:alpha/beta hydrolase [Acidobacteriota bacterium]MCI0724280.1 alpha/beta hydrolase [Acidobacteriota bacterium]